jgi:hypothetical protein
MKQIQVECMYTVIYIVNKTGNLRTYNVTLRRVRVTIVAMEKQYVTYSECVSVPFTIQHGKRIHHVPLSSVASLAVLYFSILSHKVMNFEEKKIPIFKCVLVFSTTLVRNISHS